MATSAPPPAWAAGDADLLEWLPTILRRHASTIDTLRQVVHSEGSVLRFCFANGLAHFGMQRAAGGVWFREWAPSAIGAALVGDFNGWDPSRHPCRATGSGVFEVFGFFDLPTQQEHFSCNSAMIGIRTILKRGILVGQTQLSAL